MSEVSGWVPIVVALFGLAGVLVSQVIAGRREDKRWLRDSEREDVRWDRDRHARTYEARSASYAEVIGVIEEIDWALYRAFKAVEAGQQPDEHLTDELRGALKQAGRSLGAFNLHSPEPIRATVRESMLPRSRLATVLLDGSYDKAVHREHWNQGKHAYKQLRAALRSDLGLDAEEVQPIER